MSESDVELLAVGRRQWVDVLLVVAGVSLTVAGWPIAGLPLILIGLLMPARSWFVNRHASGRSVARLVPPELAAAHAAVIDAASLPGVVGAQSTLAAADESLLEVAAVLAGDPPRGGAQRRFVAARVRVLDDAAHTLRERHDAWVAACAEVESLSGIALPEPPEEEATDHALVGVLVVALAPAFLFWEVVVGAGRGVIHLADGLVLRVRTAARLLVHAGRAVASLAAAVVRSWADWRRRVLAAMRAARHRFVAARVRLRLRWRQARRGVRRS